jgi:aminomethyltransferase
LQKNIGLGFVAPEFAAIGTEFDVIVRGKPLKARVVKTPFYTNRARGK